MYNESLMAFVLVQKEKQKKVRQIARIIKSEYLKHRHRNVDDDDDFYSNMRPWRNRTRRGEIIQREILYSGAKFLQSE